MSTENEKKQPEAFSQDGESFDNDNDKNNMSDAEVLEDNTDRPPMDFLNTEFEDFKREVPPDSVIDEDDVEEVEAKEESSTTGNAATEGKKEKEYTLADYEDVCDFGLEAIDLILSNSFRALAQEKEAAEFELSETKKKKLSGMLAKILHKHKFKVTIEIAFVFFLITCYFPIVKKAWAIRKRKNKEKEELELKQNNNEHTGESQEDKRGPGRPRKNKDE